LRAGGRFEARSADEIIVRQLPDESARPRKTEQISASAEGALEGSNASAYAQTDNGDDSDLKLPFFRAFSANRFSYDIPRARRLTLGLDLTNASRLKTPARRHADTPTRLPRLLYLKSVNSSICYLRFAICYS
jgi:hypothetical protein